MAFYLVRFNEIMSTWRYKSNLAVPACISHVDVFFSFAALRMGYAPNELAFVEGVPLQFETVKK